MQETEGAIPGGREDPLEEEMATHSSLLAWRIPGTEEPSGLPSMGLHRVGHDWNDLAAAAERDMKQQTVSKWGKEYAKAVHCHSAYLTYMQNTSCEMLGWMTHKLE